MYDSSDLLNRFIVDLFDLLEEVIIQKHWLSLTKAELLTELFY